MNGHTSTDPLQPDLLTIRKQILFSFAINFTVLIVSYLDPHFPFPRQFLGLILGLSFFYLIAYLFLWKLLKTYYTLMLSALSMVTLILLFFILHLSGGIVSPFVFSYYAILISEAAYGGDSLLAIAVAILSYLAAVLSEFFGLLPAGNAFSAQIYSSPVTTSGIIFFTTAFMAICGYLVKLIVAKLKGQIAIENRERQAMLSRLSEFESHSQMGTLAHRIVHDLRGPLSAISGYIQVKMLDENPPKEEALLKDLNEVVLSMSESLNDITSFGRPSPISVEKVHLADFMDALVAIVSYSPNARGVRFVKRYSPDMPAVVTASRPDLQQAYFNLIKNAVEAVRDNADGKVIEVAISEHAGEAVITLSDNGPGMEPELLKTIFRRSITTKKDGTGVGLTITRDLLTRNNVDLQLHNLPEGGFQVLTRLPLASRAAADRRLE